MCRMCLFRQRMAIPGTTRSATRTPATAHASTATNGKDFHVGNVTVFFFVSVCVVNFRFHLLCPKCSVPLRKRIVSDIVDVFKTVIGYKTDDNAIDRTSSTILFDVTGLFRSANQPQCSSARCTDTAE